MKVILAEYSGFCFGVKRAVDMARQSAEKLKGKVYSYGELIHNAQVVELLEKEGIGVVDEVKSADDGSLIIRSHGVPKSVLEDAENRGIGIIDATCPFVKKIQKIVHQKAKEGYHILILGDRLHPEVVGINGWCENTAEIAGSLQELAAAGMKKGKYAVVAQTTLSVSLFKELESELCRRIPDAEIYNTICTATYKRQESVRRLAQKVDAMVIVGGKKSSNTKKLAEIASLYCPSYLIETAEEIDRKQMKRYKTLGVTAGASTPDFVIKQVIESLENLNCQETQVSSSR